MKLLLPISTTSKQQLNDSLLTMTLQQSTYLLKDLGMHTTAAKMYVKDPQMLAEVIRLVGKFNAAKQQMATLTSSMVSMMSNDDKCFVCGQMGHFGHHCPNVQCDGCDKFHQFAKDFPTRSLPQEDHATKTDLIQGINIPRGTAHTPPIMVPELRDISANHNPTTIPTVTGAAVSEGTHHTPHPATAVAYATLWLIDAPIAICIMTHPTNIVTPHPALNISSRDVTHATIPQTRASLTPLTPTTLHRKHSQEKPSHTQDLQPPINPTFPRLSSSGIPLQILPQIQTVSLIL